MSEDVKMSMMLCQGLEPAEQEKSNGSTDRSRECSSRPAGCAAMPGPDGRRSALSRFHGASRHCGERPGK